MKQEFIEHFDEGHRDKEYTNKGKIILFSILGGLLLLAAIIALIFFLSNKGPASKVDTKKTTEKIILHSTQTEWAVSTTTTTAEDKVWLESDNVRIKSAEIYDGSDKKVAEFSEDASNNMLYTTIINVPVDKAQELEYYAICVTTSSKKLRTNTLTFKIYDVFPDEYYSSEKNTDTQIKKIIESDEYTKLKTSDDKSQYLIKQLEELAKSDPSDGSAYVIKDSIGYDEKTDSVYYAEAAGTYCYIALNKPEEGVNELGADSIIDNVALQAKTNTYFSSKNKNKVEGEVLVLAAVFETEAENEEYYSATVNAINEETSLNATLKMATLDNLRYEMDDKDFVVVECHGNLFPFYGVTVPMFASFSPENEKIDAEMRSDLNNHRICKYYSYDYTEFSYTITPTFFYYYYGVDGLEDTIIHLGSCLGFGDDVDNQNYYLSSAFISSGATAVVGHINSVYTIYDRTMITSELDLLLDNKTIGEALIETEETYGYTDTEYMLKNYTDVDTSDHIPAYNNVHGSGDATLSVKGLEQPTEPPATDSPQTKPASDDDNNDNTDTPDVKLSDYVSSKPYKLVNYISGCSDLIIYFEKVSGDKFSFRINERQGYTNFTDTLTASLDEDGTSTFKFSDNRGLNYVCHMEFVDKTIYVKITYNDRIKKSNFTLDCEGYLGLK